MHLFTTDALKLNVLVYVFAACQICIAISESYILQARLIHMCVTLALLLYVQVRLSRLIKNVGLFPQDILRPRDQQIYKKQASQR